MPCVRISNGIMCFGDPTIRLKVGKRYMAFEMHRFCGPMRCSATTGEPTKNGWSEKSPFWSVFDKWLKQGERVDDNGYGIVD